MSITVKEMIEKLSKLDPNAILVNSSNNFEKKGATVPITSLYEFDGKIEKRKFRDAFDGEIYESDVVSMVDGKDKFVMIS